MHMLNIREITYFLIYPSRMAFNSLQVLSQPACHSIRLFFHFHGWMFGIAAKKLITNELNELGQQTFLNSVCLLLPRAGYIERN